MKNVIIIGYRCTGKTSVGKKLSKKLGRPFIDTDELITLEMGMSVDEIVQKGGWPLFRQKERDVIMQISSMEGHIIATGGGAFEDPKNGDVLRGNCLFVWLTADTKTIVGRMLSDRKSINQRPPLSDDDLEVETALIIKRREPVYCQFADLTIDTSQKAVDLIVDNICAFLKNRTD